MEILHFDDCSFEWQRPSDELVQADPQASGREALKLSRRTYTRATGNSLEGWFASLAKDWIEVSAEACEHSRPQPAATATAEPPIGMYLIHANGCFVPGVSRQDLQGVEILKHIRLTYSLGEMRRWHAVVYSFEPLENILRRKPENLILVSSGVTFLQLPDALELGKALREAEPMIRQTHRDDKGGILTLSRLASDDVFRASVGGALRPFIACDYRPPDTEHAISNWWGVRQLTLTLAKASRQRATAQSLPLAVHEELTRLENKKAFFLADNSPSAGEDDTSNREVGLEAELKKVRRFFQSSALVTRPPRIVHVDDEIDKGWDEAMYFLLTGDKLQKQNQPDWYHTTMGALASPGNNSDDWEQVAELILDQKPELVLMDLRLLGSGDAGLPVKETSGGKLIGFLREKAPAVPILLMTASNKAWTLQEAFRLGVDAYWMKEGIGDHATSSTTVRNTSELIRLIRNLLEADYQLLRKIDGRMNGFEAAWKTETPPWWKKMKWPEPISRLPFEPPTITEPDWELVCPLLRNLIAMYREYLRLFTLRYGPAGVTADHIDHAGRSATEEETLNRLHKKQETIDFWLRSLVVQVGRIIEVLHCFHTIRKDFDPYRPRGERSLASSGTIGAYFEYREARIQKMRRDWFGQAMYNIRNGAAHFDPTMPLLEHRHLRSFLAALFAWLSVEPQCVKNPRFGTGWPHAADFISGPNKHDALARAYEDLYGSPLLELPA